MGIMIATAAISGRGGEVKIFTVEVSKLVCSHVFTQFPPRGFALFRNPCVCEAYWVRNSKFWYPCSLFLAYLLGLVKKDSEKNIDTTYPYSFFTTFDCVCGKKEPWKPLSIFCIGCPQYTQSTTIVSLGRSEHLQRRAYLGEIEVTFKKVLPIGTQNMYYCTTI